MALPFYESSILIYSSAKDSIVDEHQKSVNQMFDASSTYMTIKEQTDISDNVYTDINCRITNVFDPVLKQNFSDDYRKVIFESYDHNKWLGQMYQFNNAYWLATNTNTVINNYATSLLRKCNNELKWYDSNNVLNVVPCVFDRTLSSVNLNYGNRGVPQINGTSVIMIQRNSITNTIKTNQRFILDGISMQVQQINNHVSSTYMELYVFETQVQGIDDTVNNIVNGKNEAPISGTELKILPNINFIYEGNTQTFVVNKYVNGVANSDTFDTVCSGVSNTNYQFIKIDNNSFSVKNLIPSDNMLNIVCTDNSSGETVSLSVKLTTSW